MKRQEAIDKEYESLNDDRPSKDKSSKTTVAAVEETSEAQTE